MSWSSLLPCSTTPQLPRQCPSTLHSSIANLTFLSLLNLTRNRIFGHLPYGFFASLTNLQFLDLSVNVFGGKFPVLAPGNSLQTLDISENKFFGTLPGSIFQLGQKLTVFNASNNNFFGPMPSPICVASNPNSSLLVTSLDFSLTFPPVLGIARECGNNLGLVEKNEEIPKI